MGLQANAVDRDPASFQRFQQIVDSVRLGPKRFTAIIVIEKLYARISFPGPYQRLCDVVVSKRFQPKCLAQSGRVIDCLIDHIPRIDAATEVADRCLDMFLEDCCDLVLRKIPIPEPSRNSRMPDEGVPPDLHPLCGGKVHNFICILKIKSVAGRTQRPELHCTFSGDSVEFPGESFRVGRVITERL